MLFHFSRLHLYLFFFKLWIDFDEQKRLLQEFNILKSEAIINL